MDGPGVRCGICSIRCCWVGGLPRRSRTVGLVLGRGGFVTSAPPSAWHSLPGAVPRVHGSPVWWSPTSASNLGRILCSTAPHMLLPSRRKESAAEGQENLFGSSIPWRRHASSKDVKRPRLPIQWPLGRPRMRQGLTNRALDLDPYRRDNPESIAQSSRALCGGTVARARATISWATEPEGRRAGSSLSEAGSRKEDSGGGWQSRGKRGRSVGEVSPCAEDEGAGPVMGDAVMDGVRFAVGDTVSRCS